MLQILNSHSMPNVGVTGDKPMRIEGGGKIGRIAALGKYRQSTRAHQLIWIVEDDRCDRLIISHVVMKTIPGVECLFFHDVMSVIDHAQANSAPSLILTDINLLGSDGVDLVRAVRGNLALAHIKLVPIMVLSGCDDDAMRQRCHEAGANVIVTKHGLANNGLDFSSLLRSLMGIV